MIETQAIERLERIVSRMEKAQDKTLADTFKQMNFKRAVNPTIATNLLALSDIINSCAQARTLHKNWKRNLKMEEYLRIAMSVVELSEYLSPDDYKLVFRDVLHSKGLVKSVEKACKQPKLQEEAMELLWFINEGAPLYYWNFVDAMTKSQDCWNFQQVSNEEFADLLISGKREVHHRKFKHIRICYGTKSEYYDPDIKEVRTQRLRAVSKGKEVFFDRAMNILFPDKYTIGNYYIYIPTL